MDEGLNEGIAVAVVVRGGERDSDEGVGWVDRVPKNGDVG